MQELQDTRIRQLARQKALYRYSRALERGDFDTITAVLREAEHDPMLEQMLVEVHEEYQREAEALQQNQVFGPMNTTDISYEKHAWNGVAKESKTSNGHHHET
jgi:hypothetical protein